MREALAYPVLHNDTDRQLKVRSIAAGQLCLSRLN